MLRKEAVRWCCTNRDCEWSSALLSELPPGEPVCVCGSPLEQATAPRASTYLDFLWGEEVTVAPAKVEEE